MSMIQIIKFVNKGEVVQWKISSIGHIGKWVANCGKTARTF